MGSKRRNLDTLDLIKGLSAIFIVFHHYQQSFNCVFQGPNFYGGRINFGYLVEMFFIISGFLTALTTRESVEDFRQLFRSFSHKLKRIYPMTTIVLLFTLSVKSIDATILGDYGKLQEMWSAKAILANFLLLFRGWPGLSMMGWDNPLWYLCILIQCYLVFYGIRLICGALTNNSKNEFQRGASSILWIFVITVLTVFRKHVEIDVYRGIQAFGIGVCCYQAYIQIIEKEKIKANPRIFGPLLCGIVALTLALTALFPRMQREVLIVGVFIPTLALALLHSEWRNEKSSFIGKISFEVFIWHAPMMALVKLVFHVLNISSFPHSYLTMIVFAFLIVLFSWIMYTRVEIRLNKRISFGFVKQ